MVQFLIEQNVNRAASRCTHYIKICLSVKWLDSKTRMQAIQPHYTLICSYAVQKCESKYLPIKNILPLHCGEQTTGTHQQRAVSLIFTFSLPENTS